MRIFRKLAQMLDVNVAAVADGDALVYDQASGKWIPGAGGGGGAPTDVDYLVGTASGSLSAEIVVGTAPGGELGGTWASPTVDATHSGSSHASVQSAAEATAAAALSAHASDTTGVHGIADTSALETTAGAQAKVDAHVNDATDAHDASAISIADAANDFTATDVEGALAELQSDAEADAQALTDHISDASAAHAASAVSFDPSVVASWAVEHASLGTVVNDATYGSSSEVFTTDQTVAAGGWVFLFAKSIFSGSISSAADDGPALTWTVYEGGSGSHHAAVIAAFAPDGLASGTNITVTWGSTDTAHRSVAGASFTGGDQFSFDVAAASNNGTSAAWVTSALMTAQNDELIVAAAFAVDHSTPTSPGVELFDDITTGNVLIGQYVVAGAAGSYTVGGSLASSVDWVAIAVAFKPSAEGGIGSLNVQDATEEVNARVADHLADASAAHAASAISADSTTLVGTGTDVQAVLEELDNAVAAAYTPGGTDVALADGGTGTSLSDPNADRILFWDDSAGQVTWLTPGTGLTITTTTIDASGGSSATGEEETITLAQELFG